MRPPCSAGCSVVSAVAEVAASAALLLLLVLEGIRASDGHHGALHRVLEGDGDIPVLAAATECD